ncbi:MAG: hypothetical protein AAF696_09580 [Bacteroidota bacterium]
MPEKKFQFQYLHELLSAKEKKAFLPWLKGQLVGRQAMMLKMFEHWEADKNWEEMPQLLGLEKSRSSQRLEHLRNELQEKLQLYLSHLALQRDPYLADTLLLQELDRRRAEKSFTILEKKITRNRNKRLQRDSDYHKANAQAYSIRQSYEGKFPPNYKKAPDALKNRFQHWRLGLQFEALELALNLKLEGLEGELKELWNLISKAQFEEGDKNLELLKQIYLVYEHESWKEELSVADRSLLLSLREQQDVFKVDTFISLHILTFNYFSRKMYYYADPEIWEVLKELYVWSEEEQLWPASRRYYRSINNLMAHWIIFADSASERDKWHQKARAFIEKYVELLPPSERNSAKKLNQAHIDFATAQYSKVIFNPLKEDFKDPVYVFNYEVLKIQALYELGEIEEIPDEIVKLKKRMQKSTTFSALQKKQYLKRLGFIQRLSKIDSKQAGQKLLAEIKEARPLSGRAWLEKKLLDITE